MRIGFAGLGAMGGPMAGHLLEAGHTLLVLTRHRGSAAAAIAKGAIWAETAKALAAGSELVFTALPGPSEIEAIMAGADGLRAGFSAGTPYIDLSTNSPALVRKLSAELAGIGVSMLDAPVSGGPKGAASRKLAIWVGGERATYDGSKPLLDLLGDHLRYLGPRATAS